MRFTRISSHSLTEGFTLLELLIVIGILAILVTAVLITINPSENQKKARDIQRLRDANTLQVILEQYINSGGVIPGASTCLTNTTGCGSSGGGNTCSSNWLGLTVCTFANTVPVDPNNGSIRSMVTGTGTATLTAEYRVKFNTGGEYEIDVHQESLANSAKITGDNGIDATTSWVEYGTNLGLLL